MADEPHKTQSTADCWASDVTSPCAAESDSSAASTASDRVQGLASFGALLSAFIASSWCWLPPLLILGGISGAGMTTFAEEYRPILMTVTLVVLAGAYYVTYRSSNSSRVMTFNKVSLGVVTLAVVGLLFLPMLGWDLMQAGDQFTADMDRTVIAIEGMT